MKNKLTNSRTWKKKENTNKNAQKANNERYKKIKECLNKNAFAFQCIISVYLKFVPF